MKDIPKALLELLLLQLKIDETIDIVNNALTTILEEKLKMEYPILIFENKTSTTFIFIHSATHLAYHLD